MDELAFFFAEPYASEDSSAVNAPVALNHKKNRSKIRLNNQAVDNVNIIRNFSDPSFIAQKSFPIHASGSFPDTLNLPSNFPPEPEEGNIEYKLKLINPTPDRVEHLMTQMKWRLNEGGGQAIYRLGVDDKGVVTGLTASELSASLSTLYGMAQRLGVDLRLLRMCTTTKSAHASNLSPLEDVKASIHIQRKAVELHAKWKSTVNQGLPDMRVAMLGSVDVGKSTLLGILTDGEMDDGRGRARLNLFRHLHEVQSGRTSSLSSELIGFDISGHLVNRRRSHGRLNKRTIDEVIRDSHRLITFLDLAGHTKYQRTTLSGLTTFHPALCILVVSATTGLTPEGLGHARTAVALNLPLAVVVSKIDLIPDAIEYARQRKISVSSAAHASGGNGKMNKAVADIKAAVLKELKTIKYYTVEGGRLKIVECFKEDPEVFAVSSVSGYGLGSLLNFLALVSSNPNYGALVSMRPTTSSESLCEREMSAFVECWITKVFGHVPGVNNPVLEVLIKMGEVHEGQRLWLGPDEEGKFYSITVVELRHNRHPHHVLHKDQLGSLVAVPEPSFDANFPFLRRGMVMVNAEPTTTTCPLTETPSIAVCWSICIANLIWMSSSSGNVVLQPNSTVGIHAGNVLQYARVLETSISANHLTYITGRSRTNLDSVILQLDSSHEIVVAFLRQPEFLELGRQVVISVNNVAKAVGTVYAFKDVITTFTVPLRQLLSSPQSQRSNSTNSWHAVSIPASEASVSYDSLLRQVGIDPEGPRTNFVDEPPLPPDFLVSEMTKNSTSRKKRRQRNSKRRRKATERLATMLASATDLASSTTTWSSACNEQIPQLTDQELELKEGSGETLIKTAPPQSRAHSTGQPLHTALTQRRRKRKQRHRR
ncbi:unnamed protein product [Mesocestoides corti]|uniref:Tr-type G domain-containing protein n=2 Tax=Mesocestoides corti TaxID=53468 RepID=A0A158QVZ0_MESCO|nr:unnamed protein product [Mesocestoides corti]